MKILRDLVADIRYPFQKPAAFLQYETYMKVFLLIGCIISSCSLLSQDTTLLYRTDTGNVIIHKDPRLDLLVKKQIQINEETTREARRIGKGYRLLVINTRTREEAVEAKTKIYTYFPELKSYLIYQAPYFKLKAGNFKERKEAEIYLEKLKKHFPKGVYIMYDIIEIKLDTE